MNDPRPKGQHLMLTLSRRSLDDVDQRPLSKTSSTAKSSRSPGGTRKKEKQKHKRKKHKKSHRRMLNQEVCVCVCVCW